MASAWQRPDSVPFPTVYRRYAGPQPMPDGRTPNFWIQDVTPDLDERIVDFMSEGFVKEENMCRMLELEKDPESLEAIRASWRFRLQQRAALVALSDWPDGPQNPRIAGCNITYVARRDDRPLKMGGAKMNHIVRHMVEIEQRAAPFDRYGVDACLNALGLSVAPAFRGQGLGLELLLARDPLMRALGLRLTVSVFSGAAAQKQSARAGHQVLAEQRFEDCKDEQGRELFPNAPIACFQFKAKYID